MIRLDIGSGIRYEDSDEIIGVDAFTDANVKAFMWDLPYKDGEVDEIYTNQTLEHVSKYAILPTLREWNRVLKIGGILEIIVPDLEWACLWWLFHKDATDWSLDIIFGNQTAEGQFHQTGFTINSMLMYINLCGGFEVTEVMFVGDTLEDIITADERVEQAPKDDPLVIRQRCIRFIIKKVGEANIGPQFDLPKTTVLAP